MSHEYIVTPIPEAVFVILMAATSYSTQCFQLLEFNYREMKSAHSPVARAM